MTDHNSYRMLVLAVLVLLAVLFILSMGDTGHAAPLATPTVVVACPCMMTATPPPSIVCPATRDNLTGLCKRVYLPTVKP